LSSPDPFLDLRRALLGELDTSELSGVRVDAGRRARTGAPEVIYGRGKTPEQIVAAIHRLIETDGRALTARIDPQHAKAVIDSLSSHAFISSYDPNSGILVASDGVTPPPERGGRVGLLTAGSSDRPQAAEAAAILCEMGCQTLLAQDVGVAGLHRLVQPLREMLAFDPDALIVAAGMDGVLPGVVSGLVSIPIVGLPTSTGYGVGGAGVGAMTTMLQACAPGIAVVNIDNGIGAGIMAGLIANRAAAQRRSTS
jgi:pyridinium-3,5-biscarboxylic acid mononucleotide synthase